MLRDQDKVDVPYDDTRMVTIAGDPWCRLHAAVMTNRGRWAVLPGANHSEDRRAAGQANSLFYK